jgi:hypothetical protein
MTQFSQVETPDRFPRANWTSVRLLSEGEKQQRLITLSGIVIVDLMRPKTTPNSTEEEADPDQWYRATVWVEPDATPALAASGLKNPGFDKPEPQQYAAEVYPLALGADKSDFGVAIDDVRFKQESFTRVGAEVDYAVKGDFARLIRLGYTITTLTNVIERP